MLRRLYDWTMSLAAGRHAPTALAAVSFAESSFFPIPPDVMLIPMIMARRAQAWAFATLATVSSVIGGVFGYAIGYLLFETIGIPILSFYGKAAEFEEFTKLFADYGVWILIIKGMTPIPYKILTIAAGVAHMDLIAFIGASIIARALRFFIVAGLLFWFGEPIRKFVEERLTVVMTSFVVLLIGGFVAVKFFFRVATMLTRALDKKAVLLAFLLGLAAILGAWGSQVIGGLVPCELCLEQRVAYYWGLPVLALVLLMWNRLPLTVWYVGIAIATAIFAWGAYMGVYHAGVEYGFWAGPTACTGTGTTTSFDQLSDINAAIVIPCDKVQFQLYGISLAGFNALISVAIIVLLGIAAWWQATQRKAA